MVAGVAAAALLEEVRQEAVEAAEAEAVQAAEVEAVQAAEVVHLPAAKELGKRFLLLPHYRSTGRTP